jgi:hypothetical protein
MQKREACIQASGVATKARQESSIATAAADAATVVVVVVVVGGGGGGGARICFLFLFCFGFWELWLLLPLLLLLLLHSEIPPESACFLLRLLPLIVAMKISKQQVLSQEEVA